ncbi:hypothetical protein M413DRAFT_290988 [Hebeloma cylindrosporum]|uniref:Uncharacterized protein n=1 Tax=Hebeloma cylindrosporum TaxID=76867 RepID=A0A0C2Y5H4_HEBCY|nr:hypothetical protein M413DRAFT_290988 [Hebeloma cylindrosporum h7]
MRVFQREGWCLQESLSVRGSCFRGPSKNVSHTMVVSGMRILLLPPHLFGDISARPSASQLLEDEWFLDK